MNSFDVSADIFEQEVMAESHQRPILVDFWATWCGPCQSLMPLLEKLADQYKGQFKLAKVDIDAQQSLAQQYSVRSVPTLKIIKDGEVVDEMLGVQSEEQLRSLIDKHIQHESEMLMLKAMQQYQQAGAEQRQSLVTQMISIMNSDPDNTKIRIVYVNVLMSEKKYTDAKAILESLPTETRMSPEIQALLGQLEFLIHARGGDVETLLSQLKDKPDDCELRYQLSSLYVVQSNFEQALEQFIKIMQHDRKFNHDAGRKGMLKVFEMLGGSGELVTRYRQKMASLLN